MLPYIDLSHDKKGFQTLAILVLVGFKKKNYMNKCICFHRSRVPCNVLCTYMNYIHTRS